MSKLPINNKSYWHQPMSKPLPWTTIPQMIDHWAKETPEKEAYVIRMRGQPRRAITFNDLKTQTEQVAASLLDLGLNPGDFVIITGITCLEWLIVDYACASIGIHTIRCRMTVLTKEGLNIIANCNNVKALFFHPGENLELLQHFKRCIPDAFETAAQGQLKCGEIPALQQLITLTQDRQDGLLCVGDLLEKTGDRDRMLQAKEDVQPEDIATLFMTSGSTGFPKAIPFTHQRTIGYATHTRLFEENASTSDIFFSDRSVAWLGSFVHLAMGRGLTLVFVHPLTNAADKDVVFSLKVLKEEGCTCGLFLQYFMTDMLAKYETGQMTPADIKWGLTGGEVIHNSIVQRISKYIKTLHVVYGTTECAFLSVTSQADEKEERAKYTGRLENGIEVKVVNNGKVVPFGESGEILIRSPLAFRGYLQEESKGFAIDSEGWIHTSDAGFLTADGFLKVLGRTSDVISRGITLTYPMVVEQEMMKFQGVKKVSVFGVPDKRLGQNICAAVIADEGVSLSQEYLLKCFNELYQSDEGLGMTPGYFMFLDTFPDTNGKVDKKALKKMVMEKFNLTEI